MTRRKAGRVTLNGLVPSAGVANASPNHLHLITATAENAPAVLPGGMAATCAIAGVEDTPNTQIERLRLGGMTPVAT